VRAKTTIRTSFSSRILIAVSVVDENAEYIGELLIWISAAGTLAAIEYAWTGDDPRCIATPGSDQLAERG